MEEHECQKCGWIGQLEVPFNVIAKCCPKCGSGFVFSIRLLNKIKYDEPLEV